MSVRTAFLVVVSSPFLWCLSAGADPVEHAASNDDQAEAAIGQRPYEMDWAGRTEPTHPQLVDFEELDGWRAIGRDGAIAHLYRSREQLLFGEYTAKAVFTGETARSSFLLAPPAPIPIPGAFTGADLWVRGNNWGWVNPPAAARVSIHVLVRDAKGHEYRIDMGVNDFDYWFLLHATVVSPLGKLLCEKVSQDADDVIDYPAEFTGIEVRGCSGVKEERIFLDALSFYEIDYPPLNLAPVSEDLPWPATSDTILPKPAHTPEYTQETSEGASRWSAKDEPLVFSVDGSDPLLSGLRIEACGQVFQPCWKGGITFDLAGRRVRPGDEGTEVTRDESGWWTISAGGETARYRYDVQVKGRSLVVDVTAEGGCAAQFDAGLAKDMANANAVYFPYLTYGGDWPRIICSVGRDGPAFLSAFLDYYNSDASELFGAPRLKDADAVGYTGGSVYNPKTDGTRNPLRERLIVTVSRDVHDVLPTISNPPCDTGEIAKEYVWRNIGHAFQEDMLRTYKAYGIDRFIACHHEVGWREAGESFTLRDRPAPSIGDERLAAYGAFVNSLGYRFGTYTNYVDFAPVNANWDENHVCLDSDGRWQRAWPRCYALKPLKAAEFEADYAARINARYGTRAQYCDVHTAYTPWGRTDYDARTPGAGMFRTQFNSFARLLWNESLAHKGPVFSEGNYHWFYAGIVDGNYATMMPYGRGYEIPPLVDFDLLQMHPRMTDFGMGMPLMFYGETGAWREDRTRTSPWFDRFHTSTIAFGHIGFLADEWGFDGTLKSYYLLQALQQRYVMTPVEEIGYFDGEKIVDTSAAIATDAYQRGQVHVRYANGLELWCNLSFSDDWPVDTGAGKMVIPPGGFAAYRPGDIIAYSAVVNGQRHELVRCREYIYLDSRGDLVRMPDSQAVPRAEISCRGAVAVKREDDNTWWIIPATEAEEVSIGLAWLGGETGRGFRADACDGEGRALAEAEVRRDGQSVTVMPSGTKDVIKYRLSRLPEQASALRFDVERRECVVGMPVKAAVSLDGPIASKAAFPRLAWAYVPSEGEEVSLGEAEFTRASEGVSAATAAVELTVPREAVLYGRNWFRFWPVAADGAAGPSSWLDLTAMPPFDVALRVSGTFLQYGASCVITGTVRSNLPEPATVTVLFECGLLPCRVERQITIAPNTSQDVRFSVPLLAMPAVEPVKLTAQCGEHSTATERFLHTRLGEWVLAELHSVPMRTGMCIREQDEADCDNETTGALVYSTLETIGGDSLPGVFMHPPYKTGVGYAFAGFPVAVPEQPASLGFAMGFKPGSTSKDGCTFRVVAVDEGQRQELFSEQYGDLDAWAHRSVDLSAYAGKRIELLLIADVGPADDSYSDWAVWGAPRIVLGDETLKAEIVDERPRLEFLPAPVPLENLTGEDLRAIAVGEVRMETAGVNGNEYTSYVHFNGVEVGTTPLSSSDAEWGGGVVPLPAGVLQTIGKKNSLVIKNPGQDYMKIRNVCLHFTLKDGRQGSSWVNAGPYCSAQGWQFEEGTAVPLGHDLPEMQLRIFVR